MSAKKLEVLAETFLRLSESGGAGVDLETALHPGLEFAMGDLAFNIDSRPKDRASAAQPTRAARARMSRTS